MPRKYLGIVNKENQFLQGRKQRFSSIPHSVQRQDHQYNRRDDRRLVPRRSSRYRRDETWHPQIRDHDKIHSLRSSKGHVPRWSTSFLDHANRKMVKHSLPQIYPKASTGVFARHLLKNDRSSVFQTRPKPNRNEPDGEHSWRLVFVADGLNWLRKHHRRKDGGGDEPINNWSQPQPHLNFISGISRYLAHILCTFLFFHWEEDSRKVDSFGRGYSVFRSLYERELTGNFGLF